MKIARVFFDVDMRMGFEGLLKVLTDSKIDTKNLGLDYYVVFLNRKTTCFKILSGSKYLTYFKNGNRRIPLDAIQYLPLAFGGKGFEFNKAIEKSLREKLRTPLERVVKRLSNAG